VCALEETAMGLLSPPIAATQPQPSFLLPAIAAIQPPPRPAGTDVTGAVASAAPSIFSGMNSTSHINTCGGSRSFTA